MAQQVVAGVHPRLADARLVRERGPESRLASTLTMFISTSLRLFVEARERREHGGHESPSDAAPGG